MLAILREIFSSWLNSQATPIRRTPPQDLFAKPKRKVKRVFIHCSASDNVAHDDISIIKRWHTDRKPQGRGWSDVGYHFFIKKDGALQEGRPLERIPAAQHRNNTGTIAICLSGLNRFEVAQFDTLRDLCHDILSELPDVTFHGHCEVSAKECPVFDYKEVLGLNSKGRIVR